MVSMPFHQIMRSTCPVFAILIYRIRYKRTYSTKTYLSLIPIVLGVGLATYGDYYFTRIGFLLTLLGVILAAVKVCANPPPFKTIVTDKLQTVVSNRIMTGPLALSPLEILFRMSPLAFIQAFLYSYLSGELSAFIASLKTQELTTSIILPLPSRNLALALAGNGVLAFVLNISSFSTNKNAGALTITVCGNVKQSLTVLLGILIFGVKVSALNGFGMLITLAGAGWYSVVELSNRSKK
jgi:hypothetical protein